MPEAKVYEAAGVQEDAKANVAAHMEKLMSSKPTGWIDSMSVEDGSPPSRRRYPSGIGPGSNWHRSDSQAERIELLERQNAEIYAVLQKKEAEIQALHAERETLINDMTAVGTYEYVIKLENLRKQNQLLSETVDSLSKKDRSGSSRPSTKQYFQGSDPKPVKKKPVQKAPPDHVDMGDEDIEWDGPQQPLLYNCNYLPAQEAKGNACNGKM